MDFSNKVQDNYVTIHRSPKAKKQGGLKVGCLNLSERGSKIDIRSGWKEETWWERVGMGFGEKIKCGEFKGLSSTYVMDMHLSLHVGLMKTNWSRVCLWLGLFCLTLDPIPSFGQSCLASVGEEVLSPDVIWCPRVGLSLGGWVEGTPLPWGEEDREWREEGVGLSSLLFF